MKHKIAVLFLIVLLASLSNLMSREPHLNTPRVMIFPPDHLSDEARQYQGIPGLVGTGSGRYWATWYGGGKGEGADNVVMLATSGDKGNTWSNIKNRGGFQDGEGVIHIIYDYNRWTEAEILMASFTEADVMAKGPVSGHYRERHLINKARGKQN